MWQVHCTAPRTIWHFWAQPPLLTLQFSSPVRGPAPAKPEMGVEPGILPQTANLAFHLGHEEQLPGLHTSLGRTLLKQMGGARPQTMGGHTRGAGWGHSRQFCCGLSSLLSPQSLTPLHSFLCPMQRPFQHRNWSEAHWGLPREEDGEGRRARSAPGRADGAWVSRKKMGACHCLGRAGDRGDSRSEGQGPGQETAQTGLCACLFSPGQHSAMVRRNAGQSEGAHACVRHLCG